MYNLFIGCDMSKDFYDVSYRYLGKVIYLGQFDNNKSGFKTMKTSLLEKTQIPESEWFICFENTGDYSKQFLFWLFDQQIICKEESPLAIATSMGLRRGKTDKIDAQRICLYAYEKHERLVPSIRPIDEIIKLKGYLSRRQFKIKLRTSLVNSTQGHKNKPEDVYNLFKNQEQELLELINKQVEEIEKQILDLIRENKALKKNYKLVESVTGIGFISAVCLLVYTNNFESFRDPRKFCCYIAAAPFEYRSGKYKGRTKTSSLGNKWIKSIFSNGAVAAATWDPQLKAYYNRKLKQGKEKGVIYNNIINKLIYRAFATVKRGSPYVQLNLHTRGINY